MMEVDRDAIIDLLEARDPVIWEDDSELHLVPERNYSWWAAQMGHPRRVVDGVEKGCKPCHGSSCNFDVFYDAVTSTVLRELDELNLLREATS